MMVVKEDYIGVNDLFDVSVKLVKQFADWDAVEECWNIHHPLPPSVFAKMENGESFFDVSIEIHNVLKQNGVTYSHVELNTDTNEVGVIGLEFGDADE